MKLNITQKIQTAFSALRHKGELKRLLIRRFWQRRKLLEVNVIGARAKFDTSDFLSNVFFWRAPWKGGAFQWVQAPPGDRSSRKQSEQSMEVTK